MYGGVLAARLQGVPVVFITNQNYFSGPQGTTNAIWKALNFMIGRDSDLQTISLSRMFPPPDTVSEYNIVISPAEKDRYTFTPPVLTSIQRDTLL